LLGLTNRVDHCEDVGRDLKRLITILTQRLDAYQQVGDADNIFLNCQDCEKRIKKSAQVIEDYVEKSCVHLNSQKNAIYQEQQATRRLIVAQQAKLLEELQEARLKCEHTVKHMRDTDRYCRNSLEAFHAIKDHLDRLADHCDAQLPPQASTLDSHRVEQLQAQVSRLRKQISQNSGGQVQERIDHLQSLTHDLTSEVVAHESMLHDLHTNVHEYQDLRSMGRALSEERAGVIAEARRRVTASDHRSRSLSLDQRITGAQRVARLAQGGANTGKSPSST